MRILVPRTQGTLIKTLNYNERFLVPRHSTTRNSGPDSARSTTGGLGGAGRGDPEGRQQGMLSGALPPSLLASTEKPWEKPLFLDGELKGGGSWEPGVLVESPISFFFSLFSLLDLPQGRSQSLDCAWMAVMVAAVTRDLKHKRKPFFLASRTGKRAPIV